MNKAGIIQECHWQVAAVVKGLLLSIPQHVGPYQGAVFSFWVSSTMQISFVVNIPEAVLVHITSLHRLSNCLPISTRGVNVGKILLHEAYYSSFLTWAGRHLPQKPTQIISPAYSFINTWRKYQRLRQKASKPWKRFRETEFETSFVNCLQRALVAVQPDNKSKGERKR